MQRENLDSLLDSVVKYLNEHFVRGKLILKFVASALFRNNFLIFHFRTSLGGDGLPSFSFCGIVLNFVTGKVSKAKGLLRDVVCLAQNRGLLQYVDSSSYGMIAL